MFDVPILYIIFNRLDTVKKSFDSIKKIQPADLFIVADGPRLNRENETENCILVRDWVLSNIDWKCNVHTFFRDENVGCRVNIVKGISWFFENVEYGIIIEDDCCATDSFFEFSRKMLDVYKDSNDVKIISGTSYLFNEYKIDGYYITNQFYIWGWATWRKVWQKLIFSIPFIEDELDYKLKLHREFNNKCYEDWLFNMGNATSKGFCNSWAVEMVYHFIMENGKAVAPYYNLVSNVGIESSRDGNISAHKKNKYSSIEMPVHDIDFSKFRYDKKHEQSARKESIKNICRILKGAYRLRVRALIYRLMKSFADSFLGSFLLKFLRNGRKDTSFLKNVYKTDYTKHVLLSYITTPWITENNFAHTNWLECRTAGDVFNELGYQVDVILFSDTRGVDYSKYDVVYGMGLNLEKSFSAAKRLKRIFYATGCNPIYSNLSTLKKSRFFFGKTGNYAISSTRTIEVSQDKQYLLSDSVIVLGNEFTKSTYTRYDSDGDHYCNLPCFFYKTLNFDISKKDFSKARKNFLWFGSAGLLHKGLDTAIDIFLKRKDLNLYICGASDSECDFWSYYKPLISNSGNIHNLGFIDIKSKTFSNIMESCTFSIFPTVSEGGAAALLTLMGNGGVIPLTSVRSGLDLPASIKFINEDNTLGDYEDLIDFYLAMNDDRLKEISIELQDYVCKNYSYDKYCEKLKNLIQDCVGEA